MTNFSSRKIMDGLSNVVSGLGEMFSGARNPYNTYMPARHPMFVELNAAYRGGSWLARKIVDIPAEDATREWRQWACADLDADEIDKIHKAEERFQIQAKAQLALKWERLQGGGILLLGVGDGEKLSEPVNLNAIGEGSLEFIHVLAAEEVRAGEIEIDARKKNFSEPKNYYIYENRVDTSRLVVFPGLPTPSLRTRDNPSNFGDSALWTVLSAIKNADLVQEGISELVHDADVPVIKGGNLWDMLGTESEDRIIKRLSLLAKTKSLVHAWILSNDEEYSRVPANFSALPDILIKFLGIVSAASDIPATRFLGESPGGLNATGVSDIRNYYDKIASIQQLRIRPALETFDQIFIRSVLGGWPKGLDYKWKNLWQETKQEKATREKSEIDTLKVIYDMSIIPEARIGEALINREIMPELTQEDINALEELHVLSRPDLQEEDFLNDGQEKETV